MPTNDDHAIAVQAVYDALLKSKQSDPPQGKIAGQIDECLHELEGDLRRLEREILLAQQQGSRSA